ncbi:MAG: hypothetical protein RIQ54_89 [Candidatus Parcubacteria bacterium]|jgi:hypothetical protein
MWMTDYVRAVKRGLRDKYGFKPQDGSSEDEPLLDIPDGEYPLLIDGAIDYIRVTDGSLYCCNFKE